MTSSIQNTEGAESRSGLIQQAVRLAMEAAYGMQRLNDQQISQVLGGLVRSRLMTADDSYKLRDRLNDSDSFRRALDGRIEAVLKTKGILSSEALQQIRTQITGSTVVAHA